MFDGMIEELYQRYLKHPKVCTDTRKIESGCIFFALKGDNFNGNEFAAQALESGAAYAVVDEQEHASDERSILVDDVLTTLQKLANHHRRQLNIPFIGITGSNGKTTTKEFIREVLSRKYKTLATLGNLNNHIGVPLTLLSIGNDIEMAIIEMGASGLKDIEELCDICEPDYGIITNIGKAHIEGFGSFQGVITTKKELYDCLEERNGKLFLNGDNELLESIAPDVDKFRFGTSNDYYCTGTFLEVNPFLKLSWKHGEYQSPTVQSNLVGSYNFENIMAAISFGVYFDVEPSDINAAIEEYVPENNRSQIVKTDSNTLIMDAYNANPTSMAAAIENFSLMTSENKFFILGDMLELGPTSTQEHKDIIQLLKDKGLSGILVGAEFQKTQDNSFPTLSNNDEASTYITDNGITNALVLVKGSRGIRLEVVKEVL